ncbi:MAG: periplasmic divalent cation tolerance protein [Verrucomicrobiota bacterium]|nr:CutA1 divalent ion tolerance protein [Spartobacteria bacterium]
MASEIVVALSTFPDVETARRIVREIVEYHLAACGNIVPQVESIYRWEGKVESNNEALVIFKLPRERYEEFENKLRTLHPYDVPEILCFPVSGGSADYLVWVGEVCAR